MFKKTNILPTLASYSIDLMIRQCMDANKASNSYSKYEHVHL